MYVPGREQPQNPEDTGHSAGQGAIDRHRFVPRAAFREGEGRPRGQHTPHNRERTVQQARHSTAGRPGRHGTVRQARHSTVRHSTAGTARHGKQADTAGMTSTANMASTAQQAGRLNTARQAQPGRTFVRPPPPPSFPGFSAPGRFSACSRNGRRIPGRTYCGWRSPICK